MTVPTIDELFNGVEVFQPRREALTMQIVRDITDADAELLGTVIRTPPVANIKKLRESHHNLARLLVTLGHDLGKVAAASGYTTTRIQQLQNDPTFAQLLESYRTVADAEASSFREILMTVGVDAAEEIRERLHESPETFTASELLDVVKVTADRTGFGPEKKVDSKIQVSVGISDRMREAEKRMGAVVDSFVIPALPKTLEGGEK